MISITNQYHYVTKHYNYLMIMATSIINHWLSCYGGDRLRARLVSQTEEAAQGADARQGTGGTHLDLRLKHQDSVVKWCLNDG